MDGVSVAANVFAITAAAYSSAKSLYDIVSSYRDAPKAFQSLTQDVKGIEDQLNSLANHLCSTKGTTPPPEQTTALVELESPLRGCQQACDDLRLKVESIMSHSIDGNISKRDRLDLMLREKDVNVRKEQLSTYKQTLSIAIGLVTLGHSKSMSQNQDEVRKHQAEVSTSLSGIAGQIQGMQLALDSLNIRVNGSMVQSEASRQFVTRSENMDALKVLNEHDRALKQCLKFVTTVFSESVEPYGGVTIGQTRAFNQARLMVGTVGDVKAGGPEVNIGKMSAHDQAKSFGGKVTGEFASKFFE